MNSKGLNITITLKQKVFNFCNEISPVAKIVKAINTMKLNVGFGKKTILESMNSYLESKDYIKK